MLKDFKLRDYQIDALDKIYADLQMQQNVLLSAVMGAGKTCISVKLVERLYRENPGMRFLVLIHKRELILQFQKAFRDFTEISLFKIGIACSGLGYKIYDRQITLASVQTFSIHKKEYAGAGLIIIDECHCINIDTETMYKQTLDYLRLQRPNSRLLGITATPFRLGLGYIYGKRNKPTSKILFSKLNYKIKYSTLKDAGYLVSLKGIVACNEFMEKDLAGLSINSDYTMNELSEVMTREYHLQTAIEAIDKYCKGLDCICVVCVDINHAEKLLELLGDDATIVHSQLSDFERHSNLLAWENGKKRIMVSVKILIEGYDLPRLQAIVFLRPTLSPGLYLQGIGRVLRKYPGKEYGLLVDVTNNASRLLNNFDLDNPVITIPKAVEAAEKASMFKICPNCENEVHRAVRECPECGFQWPEEECVIAQALPAMKKVEFKAITKEPPVWFDVIDRVVSIHTSKKNNKTLGRIDYTFEETPFKTGRVSMFLCFADQYSGYAVDMARKKWLQVSKEEFPASIEEFKDKSFYYPKRILVDMNGRWPDLKEVDIGREIEYDDEEIAEWIDPEVVKLAAKSYEEDGLPF